MSAIRIINLGLPKTGTTTLTRALRRAGLGVVDWRINPRQTRAKALHGRHLGSVLYEDYFKHGDPLKRLARFEVLNELSWAGPERSLWPQTDWGLIDAIQRNHPQVKFLLNMRDAGDTARSMMRWGNLGTKRLPEANIPGLPDGYGASEPELARWVLGHYIFCERVFSGADNFLAFDISDKDAPDKIAAFLGTPMPWWGRANARSPKAATPQELTVS